MKVKLEKNEFDLLTSECFVPDAIRTELYNGVFARNEPKNGGEIIKLEISDGSADIIRNLCMDELDHSGFDREYELNTKGEILNSLIDKFFVKNA